MSNAVTMETRPEEHQGSQNGSIERADVPPACFKAPYSHLSLFAMSTLMGLDGEADINVLADVLRAKDPSAQRIITSLGQRLVQHGLVELQNDHLIATEDGVDYVNQNSAYIEEAYQKVSRKGSRFAPTRYQILNFVESEAGADGWLFAKNNYTARAYAYLAEELDMTEAVLSRRAQDCKTSQLIEQQIYRGGRNQGSYITNLRLTRHGEAELEETRIRFPEKVAELAGEIVAPHNESPQGDVDPKDLRQAMSSLTNEINNMLKELGKPQKDFTRLQNGSDKELRTAIDRLRPLADQLEQRIDANLLEN